MQRNRVSRRHLLGAAAGTTIVGLAGCLSGGNADGQSSDPTTAEPATDPATAATDTATDGGDTATATGSDDATTGSSTSEEDADGPDDSEGLCGPLRGSPTGYDTSGTEYVFAFDYPETWSVRDPRYLGGGRIQNVESPSIEIEGEQEIAWVRVSQKFEALTATERDDTRTSLLEDDALNFLELDATVEYDGETIDVIGPADAMRPVYQFFLPSTASGEKRYYSTQLVSFSELIGTADDGSANIHCSDVVDSTANLVFQSLRPNPDTTVDGV